MLLLRLVSNKADIRRRYDMFTKSVLKKFGIEIALLVISLILIQYKNDLLMAVAGVLMIAATVFMFMAIVEMFSDKKS